MNLVYFPHYQWAIILGASLLAWCLFWVRPRFGNLGAAFLGYLGLSGIWCWVWVENRYYEIIPYDQMALRYFASDSVSRLMLVLVPAVCFAANKKNFFHLGVLGAKVFVVVNSLLSFAGFLIHRCKVDVSCGGLGNPSIMIGLSVCLLPVINSIPVTILVSAAVLVSKSSVALGLLAIYLAFLLWKRSKALGFAAFIAPFVFGYFYIGENLTHSSDRTVIWNYMMSKWATVWNLFTGTGWGTYHVFSINLQRASDLRISAHWNTLHNDWLQMVFECGIFGSLLMLGTYFDALRTMLRRREFTVAASIILYGIYMGANPALHHAIPSLFGVWLFVYALKRSTKGEVYA